MTDRPRTPRGFVTYDEIDTAYGHRIDVQQSSAASAPHVWLFIRDSSMVPGYDPHLNVEQATRLRDALNAFIEDHGEEQA